MNNLEWQLCLQVCRRVLGKGDWDPFLSESWCAYTTFSSLKNGIHYWACGFPGEEEYGESATVDGGLWRQTFKYCDLAHLIIPERYSWERFHDGKFEQGIKHQNLDLLSSELTKLNITHRRTALVVEIKLY